MTIATTEEQIAVNDAIRQWAASAAVIEVVRSSEDAAGRDAWREPLGRLADLGVFAAALPEDRGGADARFVDLAAMLEECGRSLVPGPVSGTAVAALALATSAAHADDSLIERLAAGEAACALATAVFSGADVPSAVEETKGTLTVTGDLGLVPGYSAGSAILAPVRVADAVRWVILDPELSGIEAESVDPVDFSMPLARVVLHGCVIDLQHVLHLPDTYVRSLIIAALAAEAAGVAAWTLDTAVEYAKVREQFGAAIGSFQAVKHICAEMLCRSEQIAAAAWDLATAIDDSDEKQIEISAAVAAGQITDMVVANAKDCIQILGGIGFTFEHDAHLYLRRALSIRTQLGTPSAWHQQVVALHGAGVARSLRLDLSAVEDQREQVRLTVKTIAAADDQRRALAEAGYLVPHWAPPHGLGASPALQVLIDEELDAAGVQRPDIKIAGWAVPTIVEHGTDAQRDRFVRPSLLGEINWCQLFSEPGAGSDLAALRTKATKVDGGWSLSGQKVWTSLAREADWAICLARTDADAPKHKGITYFLVDMRSAGIDIRPLREITGRAMFNEVFLDDVFVPDDCVVGEINNGWRLARTTLANERVAMGGSAMGEEMRALLDSVEGKEVGERGLTAIGELIGQAQIGHVLDFRTVLSQVEGRDPGAASSVRKLIGVQHRQAVPAVALDLLGPDALEAGWLSELFLRNRCLSIAGGTTQILATAAAERLLGLPR